MSSGKSGSSGSAVSAVSAKQGRDEIFRQTRYENLDGTLSLKVGDHAVPLRNWSRTGVSFDLPNDQRELSVGDTLRDVAILAGDMVLYSGEVSIVARRPLDAKTTSYGAQFVTALFMPEGVEAANAVRHARTSLEAEAKLVSEVHPEVCRVVLTLRAQLRALRTICDQEENRWRNLPFDRRCEAERIFLPNMSTAISQILMTFNVQVAKLVPIDSLPDGSPYHVLFKNELLPFFQTADLVRRAFEKPRGYAGDYEMMNQIYRDGYEGTDLMGRVLHNYVAQEASSESVKFRRPYFVNFYNQHVEKRAKTDVLAVACGPAVEVQEILHKWSQEKLDKVRITLFDLDREALEHAQTKLYEIAVKEQKRAQLRFVNASVKAFLTENARTQGRYDLIYAGGLFDYIDNFTAAALIRKFATLLNPGGQLVIGNFTKDNPTKAFCHLLAHWTLIHKTETEIKEWAKGVDNCETRIDYDTGKINAFLVLTKHAAD